MDARLSSFFDAARTTVNSPPNAMQSPATMQTPGQPPIAGLPPERDLAIADGYTQRQVPAWLLSCVLHAVILVALALLLKTVPKGVDVEPDRAASVVLVQQSSSETKYFSEQDAASDGQADSDSDSNEAASTGVDSLPSAEQLQISSLGVLPSNDVGDLTGLDGSLGDALPSAAGLTGIGRPSKRLDGKAETYVFGVKGVGSKFIYVFDRSGSMDGFQGRPLASAKTELIKSIESLERVHQFQIIFYNEQPSIFNPHRPSAPRLMFGDDQSKKMAKDYVGSVFSDGGTQHMDALKMALRMAPDVIFFLTDAAEPQLSPAELEEIRKRNQRVGASINSIEFGAGAFGGARNFLVRLAEQNGGQHAYVDVTKLPLP